jgi:hypothetical protein
MIQLGSDLDLVDLVCNVRIQKAYKCPKIYTVENSDENIVENSGENVANL